MKKQKKYEFSYSCVNPLSLEELEYICDNMRGIDAKTFLKYVSLSQINAALLWSVKYASVALLLKDWHIRYFKLKKNEIDVYVMVHSAVEFVFKNTNNGRV